MPSMNGTGNPYPDDQCTYYASERYHALAGYRVPWLANAKDWAREAPRYGWVVAHTPIVPSIICLQPGRQLAAYPDGHVGVVEQIAGQEVLTTNLNWGSTEEQRKKISQVLFAPGPGVSFIYALHQGRGAGGDQPWYTYPRIDNFGVYPDPVGPYPKPDSNIMVPAGTPITALASGVVTGARAQPWGPEAYSITVKLDVPLNRVATHMAYNYVSHPEVSVGQRVNVGDTLAIAGNPYGIGTAFALCDADVYGTATPNEPFSGKYINPLLNPVPFLNKVAKQGPGASSAPMGGASNALSNLATAVLADIGVPQTALDALNTANSQAMTYIGAGIVGAGLLAGAGVLFLLTGV